MRIAPTALTLRNGLEVTLRSPEEADAEALLHFVRELSHESWRNLNRTADGFDAMTVEEEAAMIRGLVEHPRSFMIAAFAGGRVLGNTGVNASSIPLQTHTGVLGLGVLNEVEGQGLGRALMERLVAEAEAAGLWNLTLQVRTFNQRAIALYERLGFRRVGTLEAMADLEGEFADEHVYQRLGARPG